MLVCHLDATIESGEDEDENEEEGEATAASLASDNLLTLEIERKQQVPHRLHHELWFNEFKQVGTSLLLTLVALSRAQSRATTGLSADAVKMIANLEFAIRCSTERRYVVERLIHSFISLSLADQSMREMEQQRRPSVSLSYQSNAGDEFYCTFFVRVQSEANQRIVHRLVERPHSDHLRRP